MISPVVHSPTGRSGEAISDAEGPPSVQVVLGNMAGIIDRIKAPPVCLDESLKAESMSTEELSKLAFALQTPADKTPLCVGLSKSTSAAPEPSIVSSASSLASRDSAYLSDADGGSHRTLLTTPTRLERAASNVINSKVTNQKTSRNGRQSQRWHTDSQTQRLFRLVTGCVPILEGGKVLFVSSSRKPEWILPKGGWEQDEAMEEAAIRECFEEAGVLGVLGPRLSEIEYETRKAEKRRLELEELQMKAKLLRKSQEESLDTTEKSSSQDEATSIDTPQHPKEEISRISGQTSKSSDETCSVASDSSLAHTHVRMSLFPLYISEVKSTWPEEGRLRKAVDIDEAIAMCETRPELRSALLQVKERNLHHLPQNERSSNPSTDR